MSLRAGSKRTEALRRLVIEAAAEFAKSRGLTLATELSRRFHLVCDGCGLELGMDDGPMGSDAIERLAAMSANELFNCPTCARGKGKGKK